MIFDLRKTGVLFSSSEAIKIYQCYDKVSLNMVLCDAIVD